MGDDQRVQRVPCMPQASTVGEHRASRGRTGGGPGSRAGPRQASLTTETWDGIVPQFSAAFDVNIPPPAATAKGDDHTNDRNGTLTTMVDPG